MTWTYTDNERLDIINNLRPEHTAIQELMEEAAQGGFTSEDLCNKLSNIMDCLDTIGLAFSSEYVNRQY